MRKVSLGDHEKNFLEKLDFVEVSGTKHRKFKFYHQLLAMKPIQRQSSRDLWEIHVLAEA